MYEATDDPYCYPGTSVLKNLLDLRTQAELDRFEAFITAQRAREPLPPGHLDHAHYCAPVIASFMGDERPLRELIATLMPQR
jgi:cell filamentation protein